MDTEKINQDPDEELPSRLEEKLGLRKLVGQSAVFQAEVKKIPLIARCDANVLIVGATGTGKEIFARCIHYLSHKAAKPFIPVSCGAIPSDLFENELFGHERGAFTGAMTSHAGLIQEAEGGTLFLDDIDCVSLGAQTKVLRFLQEKEFRPLGSTRTQHSDTRIIASSNTALIAMLLIKFMRFKAAIILDSNDDLYNRIYGRDVLISA
jgi:transcriptional regulator with PAS, ATPase and Fis domain